MQEALKERIKQWLKAERQTRQWLAEHCGVSKKTVDNWLSSPKPVPPKALLIIERLMAKSVEREAGAGLPDHILVLRVDEEDFDRFNRASLDEGLTMRDWAVQALIEAAEAAGRLPGAIEGEDDEEPETDPPVGNGPTAGSVKPGAGSPGEGTEDVA